MAGTEGLRRGSSRRLFLGRAAAAGIAGVGWRLFGAPAAAMGGKPPPSERIRVAHIGLGGRGRSLLRGESLRAPDVEVVGVCDVDRRHLAAAQGDTGGRAQATVDYRRILDRKDVDAVVVAAPDHWHALLTIEACRAGKDVYVEKPLSTLLREGRDMVAAARAERRVVQVGIHHRSAPYVRAVCEIVRSGRLGRIRAVKTWVMPNPVRRKTPPTQPPPQLDYDRWLGPAPYAPYHPDRVHFNFRWCRDYAGGYMTDWGVHMLNVVTFALDIDEKGPDTVEAAGTFAADNLYDFPVAMEARWAFSDPDFVLTWTQPGDGGDVLSGEKYGMTFYGERGSLRTSFGKHRFYAGGKPAELPPPERSVAVPRSPGHYRDWLDAIRSRRRPIADVEIGHRTTSICLLGNIALFTGRKLRWDWRAERFVGDEEANGMLSRPYRLPYVLSPRPKRPV